MQDVETNVSPVKNIDNTCVPSTIDLHLSDSAESIHSDKDPIYNDEYRHSIYSDDTAIESEKEYSKYYDDVINQKASFLLNVSDLGKLIDDQIDYIDETIFGSDSEPVETILCSDSDPEETFVNENWKIPQVDGAHDLPETSKRRSTRNKKVLTQVNGTYF